MSGEKQDWQEICKAASNEQDPEKLMKLISQLMTALEEKRAAKLPSERGVRDP
jgi:hypothetical protein